MKENRYIFLFVFSVFISTVSQILLKKSADKNYSSRIREYLNGYVISAYSIFVLVTLINIYAFKYIPVSFGAAIESLGYIFVAFFDRVVFKVKISLKKTAGLFLIITGVIIVCS